MGQGRVRAKGGLHAMDHLTLMDVLNHDKQLVIVMSHQAYAF